MVESDDGHFRIKITMKRIVLIGIITLFVMIANAQIILQVATNAPLNKDKLAKKQINIPNITQNKMYRNLRKMEVLDKKYIVRYHVKNDSVPDRLTCIENGTQYHYNLRKDSILIGGYQNRMTRMEYDLPELYFRLPMALGDSLTGYYHGRGIYGDKLALRNYGWYKTKAESLENLLLPEGDTLSNVLRIHTERLISSKYYPIEYMDSLISFTEDSVQHNLKSDTAIIRASIDRWYAIGYRYPILESRRIVNSTNEPLLSQTLFFSPKEQQDQLGGDIDNEKLRKEIIEKDDKQKQIGFSYQVFMDYDDVVLLEYQAERELRLFYGLYSIDGLKVYQKQERMVQPGHYSEQINISGVKPGIYALNIIVDGQIVTSEKIVISK